jgi:hypothetical protein
MRELKKGLIAVLVCLGVYLLPVVSYGQVDQTPVNDPGFIEDGNQSTTPAAEPDQKDYKKDGVIWSDSTYNYDLSGISGLFNSGPSPLNSKGSGISPNDPGIDPDAIPIDGGLVILLIIGAGYGAIKMRRKIPVFN